MRSKNQLTTIVIASFSCFIIFSYLRRNGNILLPDKINSKNRTQIQKRTAVKKIEKHEDIRKDFIYPLNEENLCENQKNIVLFVFVFTHEKETIARQYIRNTWGIDAKSNPEIKMIFTLGTPKNKTALQTESNLHHDIIQAEFTDTQRNLTLKSIATFQWIQRYCINAQYIMKIDSDVHVNLTVMLHTVKQKNFPDQFVCGRIWERFQVIRDPKFGCHVSVEDYRPNFFPKFCVGCAYVVSKRIGKKMAIPYPKHWFPVDDVYMTGILREEIKETVNTSFFSFDPFKRYTTVDNKLIFQIKF